MIDSRQIPGYGEKYMVWRDGQVFRRAKASGAWHVMQTSGNPPRVCLTRGDGSPRWRPYVHTLIETLFADKTTRGVEMLLDT
jgi:hypothetical protein